MIGENLLIFYLVEYKVCEFRHNGSLPDSAQDLSNGFVTVLARPTSNAIFVRFEWASNNKHLAQDLLPRFRAADVELKCVVVVGTVGG